MKWQKFSLLVHPQEEILRDDSDRLREESFNGHFYLYTLVIYHIKNLSSFSLLMDVYLSLSSILAMELLSSSS